MRPAFTSRNNYLLIPIALRMCAATMVAAQGRKEPYIPPDISQLTCDAKKWYTQGVDTAEKGLKSFDTTVIPSLNNHDDGWKPTVKSQLESVLTETKDANENLKVLVPRLSGLVDNLYSWSEPPIGFFSKMKMKSVIWFVNGKRDNKSYYLFNGGGLWCQLRAEKLMQGSKAKEAVNLADDFNTLQDKILKARDDLDDAAQVYVQGLAKLVKYMEDVGANEKQIREVTTELKKSGDERSAGILKSGDEAVKAVQDVIKRI